jgi:hypothetical protein
MRELAAGRVPTQAAEEGKWSIKFVFDGKLYTKTHQLSSSEVKHMKNLCVQFGDEAAQQVIWRAAIKGVGTVSENIMAQAGLDYVKAHYKGQIKIGSTEQTKASYEALNILERFAAERKPLEEGEAFSEEAAAQIRGQQIGEEL